MFDEPDAFRGFSRGDVKRAGFHPGLGLSKVGQAVRYDPFYHSVALPSAGRKEKAGCHHAALSDQILVQVAGSLKHPGYGPSDLHRCDARDTASWVNGTIVHPLKGPPP